jgi:hypothetical protein
MSAVSVTNASGDPMRTRVIHHMNKLQEVAGAWAALLERSATNEPMLSPLWLLDWWRVFGALDGRRMRVLLVLDGERLVGLAPLLIRTHWHRRVIPFRRLELFGTGEHSADEVCSDYVGVLAERGSERLVAREVARAIDDGELGRWDEALLASADGDAAITTMVVEALRERGLRVSTQHEPDGDAPYIQLPETWDAYLAALSSSRRGFVRKSIRLFDKWAGDDLAIHIASNPSELKTGMAVLRALHAERWDSAAHGGAFASPLFRDFHDRVTLSLLREGALELMWMTVAGRPVVATYNLIWDRKVYFHQSGRVLDVAEGRAARHRGPQSYDSASDRAWPP